MARYTDIFPEGTEAYTPEPAGFSSLTEQGVIPGGPGVPNAPDTGLPPDPMEGYMRTMERTQQGLAESYKSREAAMAPFYEKAQGAAAAMPTDLPTLQTLPEYKPSPIVDPENFKSFFGQAMVMALLSAVVTKRPLIGALNTLTGAMQGYHQGSVMAANKKLQDFHEQFNNVVQKNNQVLQQYNMIVQNKRLNLEQQMSMLRIAAAQQGDKMMYQLASARNAAAAYHYMGQMYRMGAQLQKAAGTLKVPDPVKMYEYDAAQRQRLGQNPITFEEFLSGFGATKGGSMGTMWPATTTTAPVAMGGGGEEDAWTIDAP